MLTSRGWERCVCYGEAVDQAFIHPAIRAGRTRYPSEFDALPSLPLRDVYINDATSLQAFKDYAWRSLSPYRLSGMRYAYLDATRLMDIYFNQDTEFPSLSALADLHLVILVLGLADLPNKLLADVVFRTLTVRRDASKPTWTYGAQSAGALRGVYGDRVMELLGAPHETSALSRANALAPPGPKKRLATAVAWKR